MLKPSETPKPGVKPETKSSETPKPEVKPEPAPKMKNSRSRSNTVSIISMQIRERRYLENMEY